MISSFGNAVGMAIGALWANVLRSAPTMFGAVIVMVAFGMGAGELIAEWIRSMGTAIRALGCQG